MNEGRQPYSADEKRASRSVSDASAGIPDAAPGTGVQRPIIATVMLVALLSLFFSAAYWQLGRADEKRAVLERYATATGGDFVTTLVPDDAAEALRFRPFRLTGRYQPERQILLDNMTDGGTNGYQVLTPFVVGGTTVLINRGWLPADADRTVLPWIAVSDKERTLTARLNNFPAPGLRLEEPADSPGSWPRRLLFPTVAQLEAALGVELPAYQLQLNADEPDGYLRTWQAVDSGPEKHLGYAFQWFSFAALACIFYALLMTQWLRARRAARR